MKIWKLLVRYSAIIGIAVPLSAAPAHAQEYTLPPGGACGAGSALCPDLADSQFLTGKYIGHDEPSLLFYSNQPGAGNSNSWQLRLPKDPPVQPTDAGTGGTFNFQLHPAFWFGMALCDTMSAPAPGTRDCKPDSDGNIADSANPAAPDYIGKHAGTAFVEMQLYPPGWVPWPASAIINGGSSCDATRWCAAVAIFSLLRNQNTGQLNNSACRQLVGDEDFNFAFVTRNGKPTGPPDPTRQTIAGTFTPDPQRDLFMNSGDLIKVDMHDTHDGLQVVIHDRSTGRSGSMTASPGNGFAQVVFDPNATTCTSRPFAFHPMYSTSGEHTRVPWAAHSYNVAFSDEIGHFEYCPKVTGFNGNCAVPNASDPAGPDADDNNCAPATDSTLVNISGCTGTDTDFDGPPYLRTWPGTGPNNDADQRFHPTPIRFASPLVRGRDNYERVAFEADLPRIETGCNRVTGTGCTNPPAGAAFYPIYTTGSDSAGESERAISGCAWQFGGTGIPGTQQTFGGSSTTEFGSLLTTPYPFPGGPRFLINNFRNVLPRNPCTGED